MATRVPCNMTPISLTAIHVLFHIFIILENGIYLTINGGVISTFQRFSFLVVRKIRTCLIVNSDMLESVKYDVWLFWQLEVEFLKVTPISE